MALGFALAVVSTAANAASQRTFVTSFGNDANPCTLVAPCRSFRVAVDAVAAGGEVIALDSGGYGPFNVSKSVTVSAAPGVYAGITVNLPLDLGVAIAAGATDIVALRNLTIFRPPTNDGLFGIFATAVGKLYLENIHVSGFVALGFGGVWFQSGGTLTVANSVMEGNFYGVRVIPPDGSTATVVVRDTQLTANDYGYSQDYTGTGITHATITRTNASANSQIGFLMNHTATDRMVLESCVASENGLAGVSQGSGFLVLSGNSITGNGTGVQITGGTAQTRGNNTIVQNAMDVDGVLTPIAGGGM
jgi:hypothetical protein